MIADVDGCQHTTNFSYKQNIFRKKTKFLFFGRLLNEKGIREFIEAANKIHKIKLDCEFKIVGSIDDENPSSISRNELKEYRKYKNNKFENFQSDVRKVIKWANCDMLLEYHSH